MSRSKSKSRKIGQFRTINSAFKLSNYPKLFDILLGPAVTVGETEGATDSASVPVFISFFA